jgi:hypothetical protein
MPTLKNPRHEKFAQKVAAGTAAGAAYRAVYRSARPSTAETTGPALLRKSQVAARVAEIQGSAAKKVGWAIADRLQFFREAAELPPDQLTLSHRVCQGMRESKFGTVLIVPDKIRAAEAYGKLAGDYRQDFDVEAEGVKVRITVGSSNAGS